MRFDAAYGMNRPDRAEYFYTTREAFGGHYPTPSEYPIPTSISS